MSTDQQEEKPQRLYFDTYLQLIRNSVGTEMFRNFYVKTGKEGEFDALKDGENSCAFYVSGVLAMFNKLKKVHGLVSSTVEDLKKSGWQEVKEPKPGDVLVWEPKKFPEGMVAHIGFYVGEGKAISTSYKQRKVVEHEQNFGDAHRQIEKIYRMNNWEETAAA